ncbi:hypothetical protein PAXINDRAFT_16413 [Paxillus involutus ATCC 200175]|uniref:Unplaced genomic scaffold PAXINscaffold_80, whole genome shotgun sequence n=1 Tax=Paxillus involutus ATCC 200175 TaxID=664439 RepID=A0A0C9SRN0_PAXIN|nr:hypothetical protein PAXINDRAFT_16413 [Paxillus involutus ATCC 200175]
MPNQSRLIQIYAASERKSSGFVLVNHTNAFNHTVRELIRLGAVAPPLLGRHALLPTASVESTAEWCSEWETWMVSEMTHVEGEADGLFSQGGLFQALQDAKEQGDCLEIPYDVSQAIAMAEVAYTNLEGRAEAERGRELRGKRVQGEVKEGSSQFGGKQKCGGDRHV